MYISTKSKATAATRILMQTMLGDSLESNDRLNSCAI